MLPPIVFATLPLPPIVLVPAVVAVAVVAVAVIPVVTVIPVVAMITAVAMALVPLVPTQLETVPMAPVPEFVTSGAWKQYVDDNHTVVALPLPDSSYPDPMRWSAMTGQDMRIAGAYALLPNQNPLNPSDRTALFSPPWRPTKSFHSGSSSMS